MDTAFEKRLQSARLLHAARCAWISSSDWKRLRPESRLPLPWHSKLVASPGQWVYDAHTGADPPHCVPPTSAAGASGGQLRPAEGAPPEVSFLVAFHNNENMTAQCMEALWACASEVPRHLTTAYGAAPCEGHLEKHSHKNRFSPLSAPHMMRGY